MRGTSGKVRYRYTYRVPQERKWWEKQTLARSGSGQVLGGQTMPTQSHEYST